MFLSQQGESFSCHTAAATWAVSFFGSFTCTNLRDLFSQFPHPHLCLWALRAQGRGSDPCELSVSGRGGIKGSRHLGAPQRGSRPQAARLPVLERKWQGWRSGQQELTCRSQSTLSTEGSNSHCPNFTHEEIQAQRGKASCPRSGSKALLLIATLHELWLSI